MPLGRILAGDGDDEARKPGAASKIDPLAKIRRRIFEKLKTIGDVPGPDVIEPGARDEIVDPLPFAEQRAVTFEVALGLIRNDAESIQRIRG